MDQIEVPIPLSFTGPKRPVVEKVRWADQTVWIDAVKADPGTDGARTTGNAGFHGVSEEVWNFHIGGYQVCEKWLKDRGPRRGRPGRPLAARDIAEYYRIVIAIHETIRIMAEIDDAIEADGGWPGAFRREEGRNAPPRPGGSSETPTDAAPQ